MSKSTVKPAASKRGDAHGEKVPASFADKSVPVNAATDNDSKYQPTPQSATGEPLLGPRDGVLKLFIDFVKDLYWAENHLVKALPKMISSASSEELKTAISEHLRQTKTHVERLEKVFGLLQVPPQAKKCDAMEGLTKEGEGVIECTDAYTPARDLGIIMASQKVEHYEISAYMGLSKLATQLGFGEVADILSETLAEEQESDQILAAIAEDQIAIGE